MVFEGVSALTLRFGRFERGDKQKLLKLSSTGFYRKKNTESLKPWTQPHVIDFEMNARSRALSAHVYNYTSRITPRLVGGA